MANDSFSFEDLSDILECSICLEVVQEPKMLVCNHSYCKRCLDGLLSFHSNGTATIKCPKACPDLTKISKNETTNSLGIDYMLKNILDKMNAKTVKSNKSDNKSKDNPKCEPGKCLKETNGYCNRHASFICSQCLPEHSQTCHFTPVRYDGYDGQYYILCDEHDTDASFICCDDDYLCTYCINRHHKGHTHDTIQTQAALIREMLTEEIEQLKSITGDMETKRKETEDKIVRYKERLDEILKARKLKCMAEYYSILCDEEERLKKKFNNIADLHLEKNFIVDPTEEYKEQLRKTNVELVLQKTALMNSMNDLQMKKMQSVKERKVVLEEADSHHPLGNLRLKFGEVGTFNKLKNSFRAEFELSDDDVISENKLIDNLKYFCRETLDSVEEEEMKFARPVFMRQMGVNESLGSNHSDYSFRSSSSMSERSFDEPTKTVRNNSKNKHKTKTRSTSSSIDLNSSKCSSKSK